MIHNSLCVTLIIRLQHFNMFHIQYKYSVYCFDSWMATIDSYFCLIYKFKRCSKKECCKQCRYVKFKGSMTKWPVQKQTHRSTHKHIEHQDATDIKPHIWWLPSCHLYQSHIVLPEPGFEKSTQALAFASKLPGPASRFFCITHPARRVLPLGSEMVILFKKSDTGFRKQNNLPN